MRSEIRRRVRATLSGSPTGVPDWTPEVLQGDGPGIFRPSDAPWIIHRDVATMVGGIRALLMQALHPGSLAGVMQHSRYEEDVLGRLSGTIRWLTISTFADEAAVLREAARVNAMHSKVRGKYQRSDGETVSYRAADEDLLRWVHVAFTDSFYAAHEVYGHPQVAGGRDEYVRDWAKVVVPLGLANPPRSADELDADIARLSKQLEVNDRTRRVVKFIRKAPLPKPGRPAYRLLYWAAVDLLEPQHRKLLQLRIPPRWLVRPLARAMLLSLRLILGQSSPLEDAAYKRMAKANTH